MAAPDHQVHGSIQQDLTMPSEIGVGESSASDSERSHMEVYLDAEGMHRRKSSMIGGNDTVVMRTQCQIHQLLECQRKVKKARAEAHGMPDKAAHKSASNSEALETKGMDANLRSRLMTKKQLHDMAVGVRELSKRLGSIRLKMNVRSVFILTKAHDTTLLAKTRQLADWLLTLDRDPKHVVYVENTLESNPHFDAAGLLAKNPSYEGRLRYWNDAMCRTRPQMFDFVVTLGGDGTVLYASWLFQRVVPPVLSFSLGSLGFLTKFDFGNYKDTLLEAWADGILIGLRLRFECTIMRAQNADAPDTDLVEQLVAEEIDDKRTHRPDGSYEILNDVVVDRGPNSTMSAIELFGNDEHITTIQADGICVATPTGSTAYNLSAGGSLCHPENPVILVTAICAHTLSFRPIILPDTIVLRIGVPYDARTSSWASFDGRERVELNRGDYVTVSASRFPFANVMPQGRRSEDWVNSISRTLNWNSRQRQKAFEDASGTKAAKANLN